MKSSSGNDCYRRKSPVKTLAVALLLCAILALPVTLCAREPQRIGLAGKLAAGPEIDGRLDERCWKELRALDRFTCVITKTGPADAATRAYVGYDKKNLYVAFQCDEPKMELLKTYASKGALNPFDESVEIFIDSNHDRNTYYQLRVDVLGRRLSRTRKIRAARFRQLPGFFQHLFQKAFASDEEKARAALQDVPFLHCIPEETDGRFSTHLRAVSEKTRCEQARKRKGCARLIQGA